MEFFRCFCRVIISCNARRSNKSEEFWPTRRNFEVDGKEYFAVTRIEPILLHRRFLMDAIEVLRHELRTRQQY